MHDEQGRKLDRATEIIGLNIISKLRNFEEIFIS